MQIQKAIAQLVERNDLNLGQMGEVMQQIMTGQCSDAQIAAFLVALRMKGETLDEIQGAVGVMRSLSQRVEADTQYLVDTCGTGGDGSHLFNVSTASAFVAAAAGARVAKHGNRSVTSSSGSADVLEAAGVRIDLNADQVAACIRELGIGFMFAPAHHGAMRHAIGVRREVGIRTIFNIIGPLTNPAGAPNQVLGVYDRKWLRPLAEVLARLGSRHLMVVHSRDGTDEISASVPTYICEFRDGQFRDYELDPASLGLPAVANDGLRADNPEQSLKLVRQALQELDSDAARLVSINAAAAIYVSGKADSLAQGLAMAEDAIASGLAANKLVDLTDFTRCLKQIEAE